MLSVELGIGFVAQIQDVPEWLFTARTSALSLEVATLLAACFTVRPRKAIQPRGPGLFLLLLATGLSLAAYAYVPAISHPTSGVVSSTAIRFFHFCLLALVGVELSGGLSLRWRQLASTTRIVRRRG